MLPKKKGRIWNPPLRYYGNIFVSSAGAHLQANAPPPYVMKLFSPLKIHSRNDAFFLKTYSRIQINPPLPSLMMRSRVSESLAREASGMCSSLA